MIDVYEKYDSSKVPYVFKGKTYLVDRNAEIFLKHFDEAAEFDSNISGKSESQKMREQINLFYSFLEMAISKEFVKDLKSTKPSITTITLIYKTVLYLNKGLTINKAEKLAAFEALDKDIFIEWFGEEEYLKLQEESRKN